jgi:hypothetical protein
MLSVLAKARGCVMAYRRSPYSSHRTSHYVGAARQINGMFLSARANEKTYEWNSLAVSGLVLLERFSRRDPGKRHAWGRHRTQYKGPAQGQLP